MPEQKETLLVSIAVSTKVPPDNISGMMVGSGWDGKAAGRCFSPPFLLRLHPAQSPPQATSHTASLRKRLRTTFCLDPIDATWGDLGTRGQCEGGWGDEGNSFKEDVGPGVRRGRLGSKKGRSTEGI